jgi:hypothetical protein
MDMEEANIGYRFVIAILATWRITHLLAKEDGPMDIIVRLRTRVGDGLLGQLMDCFKCLSLWVAAPMALFISQGPLEWMLGWLAISGAACLLERIGEEPVVIQPISQTQERGEDDGMLWTQTTSSERPSSASGEAGSTATGPG